MSIKLSILDQSPVSEGSNAMEALKETSQFARKAEEWGYTRFWVSEHHDTKDVCRFFARNFGISSRISDVLDSNWVGRSYVAALFRV